MSTYPGATRSVVVGLLLAALSAGSLIAFSLFAGEADNPTGATVSAWSFDRDPLAVVLGSELAQEDATATTTATTTATATTPAPPDAATDTLVGSRPAPDAVLGTRLRNRREGSGTGDRTGTSRPARAARSTASSACPCKGDRDKKARHKKKARRDNTPQGHAYGYHRTPSKNGGNGLARGHDKASPPARDNPPGRKRGNPPSHSAAKSRGKGKKPPK